EATGASDLLADIEEAGGGAGLLRRDARDGDDGQGYEQQAHAEAEEQHGAEDAGEVAPGPRDLGDPGEPGRGQQGAGGHEAPGPDPGQRSGGELGGQHDRGGDGEEGDSGPQGAVAEHVLYEQGEEEELAEHGRGQGQHDGVAAGPVAVAEQVQGGDGLAGPGLDQEEDREQDGG